MAAGAARHVRDRLPMHDVVEQFAHVGDAVARSSVRSLICRFQYTCARTLLAPTVMTVPGSTSRIPSHTAWPGLTEREELATRRRRRRRGDGFPC
jgi:hypothetical protein